MQVAYLAGGCFWGLEEYYARLDGVVDSVSGYANGTSEDTTYQLINITGHAETVKVTFDESKITLRDLLLHYFRLVDPLSVNKQGADVGTQYRTGLFYTDSTQQEVIEQVMLEKTKEIGQPLAIIVEPLNHFIVAEEYHQDYLQKNPTGYCHIDLSKASQPL